MKNSYSFLQGFISALIITASVTVFAESGMIANISSQIFYWNNQKIELTAYNINDYNYVRLRDVADIFGVDVKYEGTENAVYLGDEPQQTLVPNNPTLSEDKSEKENVADGKDYAKEDYSKDANPLIFDDTYTRSAYNALRQSVIDRDMIIAGNDDAGYNANYQYAHFIDHTQSLEHTGKTVSAINSVLGNMNGYYTYNLGVEPNLIDYWKYPGYSICKIGVHTYFADANKATDSFIQELDGLSEFDKIQKIATYVVDRIYYETNNEYTGINEIFTSQTAVGGACGSYASAFLYLCQRADIPCVIIADDIHAWNEVYADGEWHTMDIGYFDLSRSDVYAKNYPRTDGNIKKTTFTKELLVPGSTK